MLSHVVFRSVGIRRKIRTLHAGRVSYSIMSLCDLIDCSPVGSFAHINFQQDYQSAVPFPTPGNLPNPGIKPRSLVSPELTGGYVITSAIWEVQECTLTFK